MFHYFKWEVKKENWMIFLLNEYFWIQVFYKWEQTKWDFFLFPYYDEGRKTVWYYAFDSVSQKQIFENFLKINWIWLKTAFQISQMSQEEILNAIKKMDVKFFQTIPWIWPKSAKKILLELKDSFDVNVAETIEIDQKLFKDIVKSLRWFWYDTDSIKKVLLTYKEPITREKMPKIIKRIISQL